MIHQTWLWCGTAPPWLNRTMGLRRLGLLVLALSLTLLDVGPLASPSVAVPTWVADSTVSGTGQNVTAVDLAIGPTGDAVAVWVDGSGGSYSVRAAARPAGGVWGSPTVLTAPSATAESPHVVARKDGTFVALWLRTIGAERAVEASARVVSGGITTPVQASWTPPVRLSAAGVSANWPTLAVNVNDQVTAVWTRGMTVQASTVSGPVPVSWSTPTDLSPGGAVTTQADLGSDAQGRFTATWTRFQNGGYQVQAALRGTDGVWSAPKDVSAAGEVAYYPQVAVAPSGSATLAWVTSDTFVRSSSRATATGDWSAPDYASAANADVPSLGVDAQGTAYAVWARDRGAGKYVVEASQRPLGGTWSDPTPLSNESLDASPPSLEVAPAGDATVVWAAGPMAATVVQARTRPAGGAWSTVSELSTAAAGVSVTRTITALDPSGDVLAAWLQGDGSTAALHARALDVAGPSLVLGIPSSAPPGSPVSMTAATTDTWSSVSSVSWTFSDGGTASGVSVQHTFAKAGSYSATVTATDGVGNATVRTAQLTVAVPKPVLGKLTLKPKKLVLSKPAKKRKVAVGFTLNTAADVSVIVAPKKVGKGKAAKRAARKHTLTFHLDAKPGKVRQVIKARKGAKRLTPGKYRVTVKAVNDAGTATRTTILRVVR